MAVNQDRNGKVLYSADQRDGNHFDASFIVTVVLLLRNTGNQYRKKEFHGYRVMAY